MTVALSIAAFVISVVALIIAITATWRTIAEAGRLAREQFGDPTTYTVVTDGKYYRVRGPFDTFYTIKFHDKTEAKQYAAQLAHYYGSVFNEQNWRAAA